MRYVIIRDDDTNAFTPVECLERLYRPFLERGLPVNLAAIPAVATDACMADGAPEGFLVPSGRQPGSEPSAQGTAPGATASVGVGAPEPPQPLADQSGGSGASFESQRADSDPVCRTEALAVAPFPEANGDGAQIPKGRTVPIGQNQKLVRYLMDNPGYHIVQHGCHHEYLEFDRANPAEVAHRLDEGSRLLQEAGFPASRTFVAPYDRLSRASLLEVASRFRVLSTGWYELGRLPYSWWPYYALKKVRHSPHWQVGRTLLLSHPGCLLSCHHTVSTMLGAIFHYLENQRLTVLVTHWWEYYRNGGPDQPFIEFLHETAAYLATHPQLKVISFDDLLDQRIPLN